MLCRLTLSRLQKSRMVGRKKTIEQKTLVLVLKPFVVIIYNFMIRASMYFTNDSDYSRRFVFILKKCSFIKWLHNTYKFSRILGFEKLIKYYLLNNKIFRRFCIVLPLMKLSLNEQNVDKYGGKKENTHKNIYVLLKFLSF